MAKATSASKARKEQMLKKFSGEAATTATLKQAERDRSVNEDWHSSWWAKYLNSYESTEMMALRILDDQGVVSDSALLQSMLKILPGTFSRLGTSMSEVIERAQHIYSNGVVIDEDMIHNGIIRRFAKKLVKLQPVLYIGLTTDAPEEVPWYEGPAPSWTPPEGHAGDWVLTPDYACIIFKVPSLHVPKREYSNERERVHKLIALHQRHYRQLLDWAARDEILVLTRKFHEQQEGEAVDAIDVGEQLTQLEIDEKFTAAGYLSHLKTPQLGLHESHQNSSPTIEASAAALANIMREEIVGRNYYGPAVLHRDGTYRRQLVIEEMGLIGELENTSEELRRHIRLIAFLHSMGSLYYLAEEKVGRDRQIYRSYKRMSPEMIANEWNANSEIDHPRVIKTYLDHRGEVQPMTVHVVPAHNVVVKLKGSKATEMAKRKYVEECLLCDDTEPHYVGNPGEPVVIHVPRRVYDGDSRHYLGEDEQYLVMTRELTNRTELQSFEEGLSKKKMAKAMDAYYNLLRLARHKLMEADGFIEGPRMANGLFYSKLHPEGSGRGQEYIRVDAEGVRHPKTDALGWWFDWDWAEHSSFDPDTLIRPYSDTQFTGVAGEPMKYGEYAHFYTDAQGNNRVKNFRGVIMHPEHDGCVLDGKLTVSRVAPTYQVSELDEQPETPLVESKPEPKSDKDTFNEALTSLLLDIKLGSEEE